MSVRLAIYERVEIAPGTDKPWRYKMVIRGTDSQLGLTVSEAPQVGDHTSWGYVIARSWLFVDRGRHSDAMDDCQIIVDPNILGPFVDEAELTPEESDD